MEFFLISPDKELSFKKPLTVSSKENVSLTNKLSEPIAFKIKTTAPKQYCVRPNSGRLSPGESANISVLLQAMKEDPPSDFVSKDKFLVQAIKISQDILDLDADSANSKLSTLWSLAEDGKKSGMTDVLYEKKLKVIFVGGHTLLPPSISGEPAASISFSNERSSILSTDDDSLKSMINSKEKELTDAQMKIKALKASLEQSQIENDRLNQGLKSRKSTSTGSSKESHKESAFKSLRVLPDPLLKSTILIPIEWVCLIFVILVLLLVLLF